MTVRVEFTPEQLAEVRRLQGLYPDRRAALLPVLQLAPEAVGHISPEAAAGGPIAALRDGDMIRIDLDGNRLEVELSDAELKARLAQLPPFQPRVSPAWKGTTPSPAALSLPGTSAPRRSNAIGARLTGNP